MSARLSNLLIIYLAEETSKLSSGAKVTIIILLAVATLVFVIGILYVFHRKKMKVKYHLKFPRSFNDIDYGKLYVRISIVSRLIIMCTYMFSPFF